MSEIEIRVNGKLFRVAVREPDPADPNLVEVRVNGRAYEVRHDGSQWALGKGPAAARMMLSSSPGPSARAALPAASGERVVLAPMPGTVLLVVVEIDQQVRQGDPLIKLEAMKMETNIPAPAAGTVTEVLVKPGQRVNTGEALVRLG